MGEAGEAGAALAARLDALADAPNACSGEMDFRFPVRPARHLFSLGYLVNEGRLDGTYYDLLASEARLPARLPSPSAKRPAPIGRGWAAA
ncbi:hypothetical protein [Methylomagnum ishizawai]|uniref:hypothetical protein n=1 Tax=Methylomagnum ishizawai TaxID=1760988 RepID=UPI0020CADF6F|nr:hypothetical protein [Methylomagnum ishizawai]